MHKVFNGLVTTTAFKYLITIAATAIAQYLGLAEGDVAGILSQFVALVMLVWGVLESAKSKVVIDGEYRRIPDSAKDAVTETVDVILNDKGDRLVGKVR